MSETLSFPGLGWSFNLNRTAFTVGGVSVYWYGIIIALSFLVGAIYLMRRVKAFGLDADRVMDVLLGGVVLGIVGARLYYVAFSWDTYKYDLTLIFNIREGGIAIYGGIIGAVVAAVIICKLRRVRLLPMLDLAAGALLLGQGIGRWGNFVNIEAFGSNTTAPWGMTSPSIQWYLSYHQYDLEAIGVTVDPFMPVHPTFFYESLWCLVGFAFIAWYTSRRRFDGELALIYLGWYGLGRFFIEGLRTDSLLIGTIRVSQMLALICVIVSVIALVVVRSKIRRANDPDFMQLYVDTEEGQAVLSGEFYKKKDDKAKPADGEPGGNPGDSPEESGDESGAEDEDAGSHGEGEEQPAPGEEAEGEAPTDGDEKAEDE